MLVYAAFAKQYYDVVLSFLCTQLLKIQFLKIIKLLNIYWKTET